MIEKRFTIDVLDENNWLIQDTKTGENANPIDGTTNVLKGLISTLNKLNDENEQLRLQLNLCSDQRNEFHRGVRENANRVGKLKKENKRLKKVIQKYYDTTNPNKKQLISDLIDCFEVEGIDVEWMNKK